MSMHLCFNSNIIACVNAQCTVILEFFVACQIDKFWLFMITTHDWAGWHQMITILIQLSFRQTINRAKISGICQGRILSEL